MLPSLTNATAAPGTSSIAMRDGPSRHRRQVIPPPIPSEKSSRLRQQYRPPTSRADDGADSKSLPSPITRSDFVVSRSLRGGGRLGQGGFRCCRRLDAIGLFRRSIPSIQRPLPALT